MDTFAVDNVELLAPVGGLLESLPTTARNPLRRRLLDNDPVFLFWNETDLTWDAIGRDRGGTLRHAKVQGTFENQSADVRRPVTVKTCGKDGGNVEGDEFTVLTGLAPGFATALFDGDLVDYLESEAGDRIINIKEGTGAGHRVWQGNVSAHTSGAVVIPGGNEPDWSHGGSVSGDDNDNRPPYYVLAAIQRVN